MIVLGIDPGLASTGYGVVERRAGRFLARDGGVIETSAQLPLERRLTLLHARLLDLLTDHGCEAVALESLYFGGNAHSAFAVGQARGVCMLAAGQRGLSCASYTPQQIKAAVCGHGRAPKDQVARMVSSLLALGSVPSSDHAADALAVAVCHINAAPLAGAIAAATAGVTG